MRYELSLSAYDPDLGQGENAESNLLFLGLRTVLYADATQVGGRTHRDVLEELQRKIDAGTADTLRVRAHYAVCPDTTNWRNP